MSLSPNAEKRFFQDINILDFIGLIIILVIAFIFQFHAKEMPGPLCLLERFGFLMMGFGLLMNLVFGLKPSHYALSGLAALFTAVISLRQMLLHIVPGTGSYGGTIFGWHLYTWTFLFSGVFLAFIFAALLCNVQFNHVRVDRTMNYDNLVRALGALFVIILLVNVVGAYMECGFLFCPDNPVRYLHSF